MTLTKDRKALTYADRQFLLQERQRVKDELLAIFDERFGTQRALLEGAKILVEGYRLRDVYDHAPGVGCYQVDDSMCFYFRRGTTLGEYRKEASRLLAVVQKNHAVDPDDPAPWAGDEDGVFVPTSVRVVTRHGQTIDHYHNGKWVVPVAPQHWEATLKTIHELKTTAQEEMRSDSFFSSRGVSLEASVLQYRLDISRNRYPQAA